MKAKNKLPDGWFPLENKPPDELVMVIDAKGNKAFAYPTYYPFKVVPNSKGLTGKWKSEVVPCEPYWDGGWIIECNGLTPSVNEVVGWKTIDEKTT
jgi:hypothetical protein